MTINTSLSGGDLISSVQDLAGTKTVHLTRDAFPYTDRPICRTEWILMHM